MEYIVAFSIRGFVDIWILQTETQFQRGADEGGMMMVRVSSVGGKYSTEINDENETPCFGEIVSSFISDDNLSITLLHFNTYTVSWDRPLEELRDIIMKRISPSDRFVVAKIDGPVVTNFSNGSWLKSEKEDWE